MVFYTSLTDCSSSSNDGRIFVDESDYRTGNISKLLRQFFFIINF